MQTIRTIIENRINAYGVPAITYGPGFGTHLTDPTEPKIADWDNPSGIRRGVGITNMMNCAKVYAMAAHDITITCDLHLAHGEAAVLTTDLSHAYIDENRRTS